MKIPEKIKIGNRIYKIVLSDKVDSELGAKYAGAICYDREEIVLEKISDSKVSENFLHEIIHGIFYNVGAGEVKESWSEEYFCEVLAKGLMQVIQDNKLNFYEIR